MIATCLCMQIDHYWLVSNAMCSYISCQLINVCLSSLIVVVVCIVLEMSTHSCILPGHEACLFPWQLLVYFFVSWWLESMTIS
jgi:hypothetical protein